MFKKIFMCFLLVILYFLITNKKIEEFKNVDYSIVLFFTENLCEEAKNCIKSLEKIGLKNKVVVYALDNNSYQCSKNENVITKFKNLNLKKEASHGTKDFYEITFQKLLVIEEELSNNKIVIYSDTDIVYLKDIRDDIDKFINSNYDIMFQSDTKTWENIEKKNLCTGFMFFKSNNRVMNCIKYAQKLMKDNWNNREWDKGSGGADQKAMNIAIKKNKLNIGLLDSKDYVNGFRYFNNTNTVYKDYKPKIIHNNWIKGLDNKVKRFKKHNLWFIDLNEKEHFTDNINVSPKLYGTQYGGFYLPSNLTKDFFNTKNIP